jgi:hypothetical protein
VGAWLALAMIVMACPPFEWIVDLILLAAFALWFITTNRAGAARTWIRLRRSSTIVLVLLLLVLTTADAAGDCGEVQRSSDRHRRFDLIGH